MLALSALLLDPRLFNFLIMALYAFAVLRWAVAGNAWASCYWLCALGLTVIITFGKPH